MTNFAEMGKTELRAACKSAGVLYSKLNNDGMRAALAAAALADKGPVANSVPADLSTLNMNGVDGHCPHCGIDHINNGYQIDSPEYKCDTNEFACLGCGGEWGPKLVRKLAADRHSEKGVSIEKVRVTQNGVTRPSAGGKCRAVWDALDAFTAEEKGAPTVAQVRDIAADEGWNSSNATIEFYQWRKFNGITGRN